MHPVSHVASRASAAVLALACASALATAPVGAQGAQGARDAETSEMERPEVVDLRLDGVKSIDKGELRDALSTKASHCLNLVVTPICWVSKSPAVYERRYLDRTEFKRDVIRLLVHYYRRGWRDATVDTSITRVGRNRVRVRFAVTEGPPTTVTAIATADPRGSFRPRRGPGRGRGRGPEPKVGEPLNLLRLDSTVVRVRTAYWNRGFGDATVAKPEVTVDDSANTASIRIPIERGPLTPIGSIRVVHIDPNPRIDDETIRNSLLVNPGELFRRDRVADSQRALYESGLFRSAVIDTAVAVDRATGRTVCAQQGELPSGPAVSARAAGEVRDSVKNLAVCVLEAPPREVRTSFGFTTADFFQVEGRFTHNYWLNSPRRLTLSAIVGNLGAQQLNDKFIFQNVWPPELGSDPTSDVYFSPTYQVGADVTQRWFRSPRNTLSTGIFFRRRSSPGVFVDRGNGVNASFTRSLTPRTPASLSYTFEVTRVEAGDVYFCVNYGVCDRPTINALGGQQRLSPVALAFTQNTTDAPLSPARGSRLRAEIEHASQYTASDFRYNRLFAEGSVYRRLTFRRTVLAARARAGWVNALGGTNEAVGVKAQFGTDAEGDVLHPRKRFYTGGSQSVRGFGENQLGPRVLTVDPQRVLALFDSSTTVVPGSGAFADSINSSRLSDDDFVPRPVGGTTLLEASVEARIPLFRQFTAAVFVDGAILGERSLSSITSGTSAITPGFGVRYISPVGPIRVDIGVRPRLTEVLPVITQIGPPEARTLIDLSRTPGSDGCGNQPGAGCRSYSGGDNFLRRLTLHLSIGEAF